MTSTILIAIPPSSIHAKQQWHGHLRLASLHHQHKHPYPFPLRPRPRRRLQLRLCLPGPHHPEADDLDHWHPQHRLGLGCRHLHAVPEAIRRWRHLPDLRGLPGLRLLHVDPAHPLQRPDAAHHHQRRQQLWPCVSCQLLWRPRRRCLCRLVRCHLHGHLCEMVADRQQPVLRGRHEVQLRHRHRSCRVHHLHLLLVQRGCQKHNSHHGRGYLRGLVLQLARLSDRRHPWGTKAVSHLQLRLHQSWQSHRCHCKLSQDDRPVGPEPGGTAR